MATTYTPLYQNTLSVNTSSVTISVPSGYTDLVLVVNCGFTNAAQDLLGRINGDTGSNYSTTILRGTGSSALSARNTNATNMYFDWTSITQNSINANYIIHYMNYSNTTTYKTVLNRMNDAGFATEANVNLWRSTSAITSLTLFPSAGNILAGSTFSLYGVASAGALAKATGGDLISTDGTYWYHTFTTSGTFTPLSALSNVDYLVVAGGGGGGWGSATGAGGGGAGGLRSTVSATGGGGSVESKLSLSATGYTVTIGAGGAGSASANGSNGNNSVFGSITSTGGGGGGAGSSGTTGNAGLNGGSGGGAGGNNSTIGTGTTNQGYAGGAGAAGSYYGGGGGGGASAVGVAGSFAGSYAGPGGAGASNSITGSSVAYAGGGGGGGGNNGTTNGAGGIGGGGRGGGASGVSIAGTANTGGGGGGGGTGGGGSNQNGSAGGSGIVIVRYAV